LFEPSFYHLYMKHSIAFGDRQEQNVAGMGQWTLDIEN